MERKPHEKRGATEEGVGIGLGGILKGLGDLVDRLSELAESGEELSQTGEIQDKKKQVKGIYGFTVKVGLGGERSRVEPFGNLRKDEKSGRTVVQEYREPVVDVFDEEDYVLVVAEMPGISSEDIQIEVDEDVLTFSAEKGDKRYRKEILLPRSFRQEQMQISCNNGVLEIKCVD
jgi:HSP20 family protein